MVADGEREEVGHGGEGVGGERRSRCGGTLRGECDTCWVALLDSPDAGASRRSGRHHRQFELIEGEGRR